MIKRGDHNKWHCGDWAYDVIDPRHVGRIVSVTSFNATIEWRKDLESIVPLKNLRRVK